MKKCDTLEKMLKLSAGDRERTGKVIARSFYKLLRQNGFTQAEIMDVAGYLLDGVIGDMKTNGKDKKDPVVIEGLSHSPHSKEVA